MAENNSTRRASNFVDLTGKQFGKWTVICKAEKHPTSKHIHWICLCECGTKKSVKGTDLTGNRSHGCATCSQRQHGMYGTPEYYSWRSMKQRCYNQNSDSFPLYGGTGKVVCERWQSFQNFYDDMGPKPSASHSIDRIDGSKGYYPENCRWATPEEQARNTRTNRLIEHEGRTQCLAAWADEFSIPQKALYKRLKRGWPIERALTEPVKEKS